MSVCIGLTVVPRRISELPRLGSKEYKQVTRGPLNPKPETQHPKPETVMESAGVSLTNCQACCPARGIRILCAAGCKLQKRNILGQTAFEIAAALGKDMALEELSKQAGPDNRHASSALYFASACCGGSA